MCCNQQGKRNTHKKFGFLLSLAIRIFKKNPLALLTSSMGIFFACLIMQSIPESLDIWLLITEYSPIIKVKKPQDSYRIFHTMGYVGGNSLFAIPYTFATTLVSPTTLSTQSLAICMLWVPTSFGLLFYLSITVCSFFVEIFENRRMSASGF